MGLNNEGSLTGSVVSTGRGGSVRTSVEGEDGGYDKSNSSSSSLLTPRENPRGGLLVDDLVRPRTTMGGDECLSGDIESRRPRCPGSLRGAACFPFTRTGVAGADRRFWYTRSGVPNAGALPDPPLISRALSFIAAATASAED